MRSTALTKRRTAFLQAGATVSAFDRHFTERTIKVIFDGALGSRGAALLKPYSDAPETSGYLTTKPEELRPMLKEALRQGIQVETHAIGDRANREILDLYEEAFDGGAAPATGSKTRRSRAGAWSTPRFSIQRTSRASPGWASFRRCSRRTRSAICFSRRRGSAWSG